MSWPFMYDDAFMILREAFTSKSKGELQCFRQNFMHGVN